MLKNLLLPALLSLAFACQAQVNFTANDQVFPYMGKFRYGANLQYYPGWTDLLIADIAMGKPSLPGIGVDAFRGSLTEEFLENWGYGIRVDYYEYYESLGAGDELVIAGYPGPVHRSTEFFCAGQSSELFANLYEPIWDGGANGTPINEENYFANYMWQMVGTYKDLVRFWEIWNEPDYTLNTALSFAPPGTPGNWWENNPDPCDLAIKAPIFNYVRLLRIAWEVIKTVDPDAYVCTGGIGNPAFLDAMLRNTDNPMDGSINGNYPQKGGAYFDVLSYHSFPHFDGSLRDFNGLGWDYHRHSDRAAEGLVSRKELFRQVLAAYGYDGNTFPEKLWVVSETNLPRVSFHNDFLGSVEAQRNFTIKALVTAQQHQIEQLYFYNIADNVPEGQAVWEFQVMGLLQNLTGFTYPNFVANESAVALKTTYGFIGNKSINTSLTNLLDLPDDVKGAAFSDAQDTVFVLWAATQTDFSEFANTTYSFPQEMHIDSAYYWKWDYAAIPATYETAGEISLTGAPIFLKNKPLNPRDTSTLALDKKMEWAVFISPNPARDGFWINMDSDKTKNFDINLFDSQGKLVCSVLENERVQSGQQRIFVKKDLQEGLYWIKIADAAGEKRVVKLVVRE
ncbi:MAG: T9SS type A sorting domain-containing protein [Saprospiraceae bacterium]